MPLIPADQSWLLAAIMVVGTAFSLWLEGRFKWAAHLSAPVIALLIAMALSNLRVIPTEAPAYDFVGAWLVPIALPLLLFRADFFKIARSTGRLLVAFHISSVGTILGALAAFWTVGGRVPEPAKAAGIMTGSYIGGMVNFMAIQESSHASGSLTSALIVADNLVMAALFVALLAIANSAAFRRWYPAGAGAAPAGATPAITPAPGPVTTADVAVSLAIAVGIAGVGLTVSGWLQKSWPADPGAPWPVLVLQTLATNRFVLVTALSLLISTLGARFMAGFHSPEPIGGFLLYLFLFTVGLPADLLAVLTNSPLLFAFCGIMAFTNLAWTLVIGKLCRLPLEELLLSVNANVGGPPTAAAMAISRNWHALVLPGVLAGLWGYIIGTPLGLLIVSVLK